MITQLLDLIDKLAENRNSLISDATSGADDFVESFLAEQASMINDLTTGFNNFKTAVSDALRALIYGTYYETEILNPTLTPGLWERPLRIMPAVGTINRFIEAKIIVTPPAVSLPTTEVAYLATNRGTYFPSGDPTLAGSIACKIPIPSADWSNGNGNLPPNISVNTPQLVGTTWYPNKYTIRIPLYNLTIGSEGISLLSYIVNTSPLITVHSMKFCYIGGSQLAVS